MKTISVKTSELTGWALEYAYQAAMRAKHPGKTFFRGRQGGKRHLAAAHWGEYADIPEELVEGE